MSDSWKEFREEPEFQDNQFACDRTAGEGRSPIQTQLCLTPEPVSHLLGNKDEKPWRLLMGKGVGRDDHRAGMQIHAQKDCDRWTAANRDDQSKIKVKRIQGEPPTVVSPNPPQKWRGLAGPPFMLGNTWG